MTAGHLADSGILVAMAAALVGLGSWARHRAPDLVPATSRERDRERRAGVVRRGALACLVVAVLFLGLAVLNLL